MDSDLLSSHSRDPSGRRGRDDLSRTARLHDSGRYPRGDQNTTPRNRRLRKSFLRSRRLDGKPQRHHCGGKVLRLGLSALRQCSLCQSVPFSSFCSSSLCRPCRLTLLGTTRRVTAFGRLVAATFAFRLSLVAFPFSPLPLPFGVFAFSSRCQHFSAVCLFFEEPGVSHRRSCSS